LNELMKKPGCLGQQIKTTLFRILVGQLPTHWMPF